MSAETMNVVLIVIIIGLTGWAIYERVKKGQTTTVLDVAEAVHSSEPLASQILQVGQIAAQAAEQVARDPSKPLMTNDQKLNYALDFAKNWLNTWFPDAKNVRNSDIIDAINAGVLTASYLSSQIKQAKILTGSSDLKKGKEIIVP